MDRTIGEQVQRRFPHNLDVERRRKYCCRNGDPDMDQRLLHTADCGSAARTGAAFMKSGEFQRREEHTCEIVFRTCVVLGSTSQNKG